MVGVRKKRLRGLGYALSSLCVLGALACPGLSRREGRPSRRAATIPNASAVGAANEHFAVKRSTPPDAGPPDALEASDALVDDAGEPIEKLELAASDFRRQSPYDAHRLRKGLVAPYPLHNIVRGLGTCRRGKRQHIAIDIGGVGPRWGLGTPVRAMVKSKIVRLGKSAGDPEKFGQLDYRGGEIVRLGRRFPRALEVEGYGVVHFFTLDYGSWASGNVVETRGIAGRFKGYRIRYMHLGAVHPKLEVGGVLEPGQELGLIGCTAILNDLPHLHLDILDARGRRVDPSPILGLPSKRISCRRSKLSRRRARRLAKRRRAARLKKMRRAKRDKAKRKQRHRKKSRRRVKRK